MSRQVKRAHVPESTSELLRLCPSVSPHYMRTKFCDLTFPVHWTCGVSLVSLWPPTHVPAMVPCVVVTDSVKLRFTRFGYGKLPRTAQSHRRFTTSAVTGHARSNISISLKVFTCHCELWGGVSAALLSPVFEVFWGGQGWYGLDSSGPG
jgi:hypothetical protein